MPDPLIQARALFTEGVQLFEAGRYVDAEQRLQSALALAPGRPSILLNLGVTRLALGRPADALVLLEQAVTADPRQPDALCHRGITLAELGRGTEALASFAQALVIAPQHAAARYRYALSLNRLGRHAEALDALDSLLAQQPELAPAWTLHGQTLQSLQRDAAAVDSYKRALALDPGLGQAWGQLGQLLKDQGRPDEARGALERAIAAGADVEINGYFLAALDGATAPTATPRAYVRGLFDHYADDFESHLVEVLRYRAPEALVAALRALERARFRSALDLGCGTGLCGPLLRPLAATLTGVDLSPTMLERARTRGAYDTLVEAEVAEHLHGTPLRHDLIVSTDVFIYLGDLAPVFAGVCRVLDDGGVFAFSVEAADDRDDFRLQPSLRYAHSARYLRALAAAHGLDLLSLERVVLREEQRRPIEGLVCCFVKASHTTQ